MRSNQSCSCIAASRNDGDYQWVRGGGAHVSLPLIACGTNSTNFLARQEVALGTFSVPFLSLPLARAVWNQSPGLGNSRGYKKRACPGLFRDHGSSFRETRRIKITYNPLRAGVFGVEVRKISETQAPGTDCA